MVLLGRVCRGEGGFSVEWKWNENIFYGYILVRILIFILLIESDERFFGVGFYRFRCLFGI